MNRDTLITVFVFFAVVCSLSIPIFMYFKLGSNVGEDVTLRAVGQVNLVVVGVCGDGICDSDESCSSCPGDCGACVSPTTTSSGGGGGGSSSVNIEKIQFSFSPDYIQERLFPGDSLNKVVNVSNDGSQKIDVNLKVVNLDDLVFIDKNSLSLLVGETKNFKTLISVPSDKESGVYLGEIVGSAEDIEKSLPVVLRISEYGLPFRLDVNLLGNGMFQPGDELKYGVVVWNNVSSGILLDLNRQMKTREEDVIVEETDKISVGLGENYFEYSFDLPYDLREGYYLIYVSFNYDGRDYVDANLFKVVQLEEKTSFVLGQYLIYLEIIVMLIILFFVFRVIKKKISKHSKVKVKVVEEESLSREEIKNYMLRLEKLKEKTQKDYNYPLVEEYSKIMKAFFVRYYHLRNSLTFEEITEILGETKIKDKSRVVGLIKKISHIPYSYSLVSKSKFIVMLNEAISLLRRYYKGYRPTKKKKNKKLISR